MSQELIRITNPDGTVEEYDRPDFFKARPSVLYALQKATGEVQPDGLVNALQKGDLLTWLFAHAWVAKFEAGLRLTWDEITECDPKFLGGDEDDAETTDESVEEALEEDPTAAQTDSDLGESNEDHSA